MTHSFNEFAYGLAVPPALLLPFEFLKCLASVVLVLSAILVIGNEEARAQQVVSLNCSGANDTAEFTRLTSSIPAIGGTLKIQAREKARCVVGGATIPANVTLDNTEGSGIEIRKGETLTILGNLISPAGKQVFFNALAGQGTISFKGNRNLSVVYPEWWGAKSGADDSPALNACSAAAGTLVAADIELNNTYNLASTWQVGLGTPFTSISLKGRGASSGGTTLRWVGPADGVMLKFWANKFSNIERAQFKNGGEIGKSVGIQLSGPGSGTQSNNYNVSNCVFMGFYCGVQAGDPATSAAASELTFINTVFQENAIGFLGTSTGNTVVIIFLNCSFANNKSVGLELGSSGDCHVFGGGFGSNGTDIAGNGWTGTLSVIGARFEMIHPEVALSVGGVGTVSVRNCTFTCDPAHQPTEGIIRGATNLTFENNYVGRPGEPWIVYDFGTGGTGKNHQFVATNNVIRGKLLNIRNDNSAIDGLRTIFDGVRGEVVWPNQVPDAISGQGRLAGGTLRVKLTRRRDTNYSITFSSDADERLRFANKTVDGFDIASSDRASNSNVTWTITKN